MSMTTDGRSEVEQLPLPLGGSIGGQPSAERRRDVLAIVGSEHWPAGAEAVVKAMIREELERRRPDLVISGGAAGVDSWGVEVCEEMGIPYDVANYMPERRQWAPRGFQARNMKIGRDCTRMLCIRSGLATRYGSGWTADYTEKLHKPVDRRVL